MPSLNIVRESEVVRSARVAQIEGLFDIPQASKTAETWDIDFSLPDEWSIGAIVGPSGSGKTTIAKELFGEKYCTDLSWDDNKSVLDGFPTGMSIKDITLLLSSVGFSSPPSWLRPFRVLSTGEQFRVNLARHLAEAQDFAVIDEFTSTVDRQVAQVASAAVSKTIRRLGSRLVVVSCHYDILEWLEPDWIYQPHLNKFDDKVHLRRPSIELFVFRVGHEAWRFFSKHHYLSANLHSSSICFCATINNRLCAFASFLHFPHPTKLRRYKRGHRTVCLPDFQGIGIGNALSNYIASCCRALGYSYLSITSHPAMIKSRIKSSQWRFLSTANLSKKAIDNKGLADAHGRGKVSKRNRSTFEYVGAKADFETARKLLGIRPATL